MVWSLPVSSIPKCAPSKREEPVIVWPTPVRQTPGVYFCMMREKWWTLQLLMVWLAGVSEVRSPPSRITPPWPVPVTSTFERRKPLPPVTLTPLMPKFRT